MCVCVCVCVCVSKFLRDGVETPKRVSTCNIHIYIYIYITSAPTCFGVSAPSSGSVDTAFAKVTKY